MRGAGGLGGGAGGRPWATVHASRAAVFERVCQHTERAKYSVANVHVHMCWNGTNPGRSAVRLE